MMSHPMSQDGCNDVRSGTDDVMRGLGFGLDHDWQRYLVSPTFPILVEVQEDELPFNTIADSTTNDLLPRRLFRKTRNRFQNLTHPWCMARSYILEMACGTCSEG